MEAIKSETKKLIDSSFVREEQYPDWVVNIIPVSRKNGKIRICIDFCDLNAAFRKDEFHLPIMNVMIDNMCGSERFHGQFFQCNQIKMYPDEEKYPFFRTLLGGTAIPWCSSNWRMQGQHINASWIQFSTSIYTKSEMLRRRYCIKEPWQRRSFCRSE